MRVKLHTMPEPEPAGPFFTGLIAWPNTPRAAQTFERVVNNPLATPQPVFYFRLYRQLVDLLLEKLRLPRSDGAIEWEWKPLYQFGETVDPFYFTEGSIHELLERWPIISYEQRQVLVTALSGFLHLRRTGFPAGYPRPLMPLHELERWTQIFPAEWAWDSLRVLRRLGFDTMASKAAYRAYVRFSEGVFEPDFNPNTLRRWFAECWRAGALSDGVGSPESLPYQANFVASAFAGRTRAMGLDGPCGYIPDCQSCDARQECRWHNAPANERPGHSEILALARRGRSEHLRTDQLLQCLYELDDEESARLRGEMAGSSLRELGTLSGHELQQRFGSHRLLPERLSVTFELCKRFNEERMAVGMAFQTPWDIFKHFRIRLRDQKQEQFIVVLLDNKKRYVTDRVITQGTLNASPVHPREVFSAAIRERAASVVIVHNHPSGDPQPSREDVHVTQQLIQVGEVVGIPVLDHIIIADDQYVSLLELGLLKG